MRKLVIFAVLVVLVVSPYRFHQAYASSAPALVISEVMANPIGSDSVYEWIEITNTSTQNQPLSEWKLNNTSLPEINLAPGEIVVVAKNSSEVRQYFMITSQIAQFNLSLPNSGSTLTLSYTVINQESQFTYEEAPEGQSYELLAGTCKLVIINIDTHSAGKSNNDCAVTDTNEQILSAPLPNNPEVIISFLNYNETISALELKLLNISEKKISNSNLRLTTEHGFTHDLAIENLEQNKEEEYLVAFKEQLISRFIKIYLEGEYQDVAIITKTQKSDEPTTSLPIEPEFYPLK